MDSTATSRDSDLPTPNPTTTPPNLPQLEPSPTNSATRHSETSGGETSGSWEHITVLSTITCTFIGVYYFVFTRHHLAWLPVIAVAHFLAAPATLKRYPFAQVSTTLHLVFLLACIAFTGFLCVPAVYLQNHLEGIVSGFAAVLAFITAEVLFHSFLTILLCDTGVYGRFRVDHGILGSRAACRFLYSVFVRSRFLDRVEGASSIALRNATQASTPPPYTEKSDNLSNRLLALIPVKVGVAPSDAHVELAFPPV
ncbi:hypothetical protein BD410DRAFT_596760 [Rickenella mellea]|uniref:Uncharacterized protein n=1 Tax=Rickenella mellea TaxID=50990 RepID=A0A4Y7QEL2_9AGAM|nr:hypothetical protein BD410DRAFT_596760 [Rickenella mellea]